MTIYLIIEKMAMLFFENISRIHTKVSAQPVDIPSEKFGRRILINGFRFPCICKQYHK